MATMTTTVTITVKPRELRKPAPQCGLIRPPDQRSAVTLTLAIRFWATSVGELSSPSRSRLRRWDFHIVGCSLGGNAEPQHIEHRQEDQCQPRSHDQTADDGKSER